MANARPRGQGTAAPRRPGNAVAVRDRVADAAAAPEATSSAPTIRDVIERQKAQLESALPKHLDVDRFVRLVLTEVRLNPRLAECTQVSLLGAVMKSAQLGLEPGPLGHCYLVPYKNTRLGSYECTFILGYRGFIDLARRGGTIKSIEAREVCEGDSFEFEYGLEERLVHKPALTQRGEAIAYYGIARFADGGHTMLVMSRDDIEKRRSRSKARDNGPWVTDYDAMARKTVIRAMAPFLPLSVESAEEVAEDSKREYLDASGADLTVAAAPEPIEARVVDESANEQGAGADGAGAGGEVGDADDGARGQDAGRSAPEPAPDTAPPVDPPGGEPEGDEGWEDPDAPERLGDRP